MGNAEYMGGISLVNIKCSRLVLNKTYTKA